MSTASLDAELGGAARVLFDSSVLIALHTRDDATHELARHLFDRVERDDDPLAALLSAVTAAEVMIRPLRAGPAEARRMHLFLTDFPHLTIVPADLPVALRAARIRADHGLKLPDALVAASALVSGAEAVVTNDEQWRDRLRAAYPEITWVYVAAHA